MTKLQKELFYLPLLGIMAILSGCVTPMPEMKSISELQAGEIVLVGKIEIDPPLNKYDQQGLKTLGSGKFKGKVQIVFDEKQPDPENPKPHYSNHIAQVPLGKTFFLRRKGSGDVYYVGGYILTDSQASYSGYMGRNTTFSVATINIPGGLKYHTDNKTRALYIGTIRYYRDDYNAITKVSVLNHYKSANRDFRRKTGARFNLRRVKTSRFKMRTLDPLGGS